MRLRRLALILLTILLAAAAPGAAAPVPASAGPAAIPPGDWPQLGRDPQRTNYSPQQVEPPFCYTWKWYQVPLASRAQPVVAAGRLFIGGMDGVLYARSAASGAPLWQYPAGSPIRHSAGVGGGRVIFSTHAGQTIALEVGSGVPAWQKSTGPSATAPLVDEAGGRVFVAATDGRLTALNLADGATLWQVNSGAPILTSPALSPDGTRLFLGDESIAALAYDAASGSLIWRTPLQGQSLAERYPVVLTDTVFLRSQPVYFFHTLLHEGDDVMDLAGALNPNWAADWANVRPRILAYLSVEPAKQTFFALNTANGASAGLPPVLYTYGNNDIAGPPVARSRAQIYLTYRARHGIQTDGGAVHVSSKYDAELGLLSLPGLDITGLTASTPLSGPQFRMTSDEPAVLTMGGDTLWVDNWERLGGLNVATGALVHVGNVSNDWPECFVQCGPAGPNPFFPLSGNPADPAYPFPSPRVNEGHVRSGVVIANGMLYWRVIEGGLAGISHRSGAACPAPQVWTAPAQDAAQPTALPAAAPAVPRPLGEYVTLDLTTPAAAPPADLVNRLRLEVAALIQPNDHWMPYYLERGFTNSNLWPYEASNQPGPPVVAYEAHGNVYWHDPGGLLYSLALAYPYLDAPLQAQVKAYVAGELARYALLDGLPYGGLPWLRSGAPRERYAVAFRDQLNNWPPHAASLSSLYALWLWSKNTGDWSYAQAHWNEAKALFNTLDGSMDYYADIAGAIGQARLAQHFGDAAAYTAAYNAAVTAMQAGLDFPTFRDRAHQDYLDPRDLPTGLYAPVFYGMTPEVGLYLREQLGGAPQAYLEARQSGDGLRWWYLTRAGAHAEQGETSFTAPIAAWSHYLAQAYIAGRDQDTLRLWLDRPWAAGDWYSIQKLAAALQAPSFPQHTFLPLMRR